MIGLIDLAIKTMANVIFGYSILSFAAVASDYCQAAQQALTVRNPKAKAITDWTHVIMNCKRVLLELFNMAAIPLLLLLYEEKKASSTSTSERVSDPESDAFGIPFKKLSPSSDAFIKVWAINCMLDDVRDLHNARCETMVVVLLNLKMEKWEVELDQAPAAKWFQSVYSPAWLCFSFLLPGFPALYLQRRCLNLSTTTLSIQIYFADTCLWRTCLGTSSHTCWATMESISSKIASIARSQPEQETWFCGLTK